MNLLNHFNNYEKEALEEIAKVCSKANVKIYLVGGVIRDLLLKRNKNDIDICIEGNPLDIIYKLECLREYKYHKKFQTSNITFNNGVNIDLIRCRREIYEHKGSLPQVIPSNINEDLYRRDFTINAIAYDLLDKRFIDPFKGIKDLQKGVIKSVHRNSYREDPTRIFRAIRYSNRYNFIINDVEEIKRDLKSGALETISNDRIVKEVILLCKENNWIENILSCENIGIFKVNHENIGIENILCNYEEINNRVLNFFSSLIEQKDRDIFINNSIIDKFLKIAFKNYRELIDVIYPKLAESMGNFDLYRTLNKLNVYEIRLLSFNKFILYKLINYQQNLRHASLKVKGDDISKLGIFQSRDYKYIMSYLLRLKLNTGIIDDTVLMNKSLGEIIDVIKHKNR